MTDELSRNSDESATRIEPTSTATFAQLGDIHCANCRKIVTADHEHCRFCGASAHPERLTFRAIAETSVEHFLSLDVPLVRTFTDLFCFPGRVASEYVAGRRKVYANPLKYNLIAAAAIVAVIHLVVGGQLPSAPTQLGNSPFAQTLGQAMSSSLHWHNTYLQLIYIATLPALAWLLRVSLGARSGRNTMEFYVMCLYAFGHLYLFQAACITLAMWLKGTGVDTVASLISGLSPYVYFPWMAVGFSRGNKWRAAIMSDLAFVLFSLVLSTTLLAVALVVMLAARP